MSEDGNPPEHPTSPPPLGEHQDEPTVHTEHAGRSEAPATPPSVEHEPSMHGEPPGPELPGKPHWKQQLHLLSQKVKQSQWARDLGAKIQNFEPAQAAEWASKNFQRQNAGLYGKAATIGLCAFFVADLMALVIGSHIPDPPISHPNRAGNGFHRAKTADDYNAIFARNLFNSQGIIPGEGTPGGPVQQDLGGAPVRTTLPFNLIGTVILQDELRSIATIEDKTASQVYPVRETDEIPSKAKIVKIEPRKVTFVNTASGRMEFIDIPDDGTQPPAAKVSVSAPKATGIEKVAPNQYNVNRGEVDKALADLNKVLTEARAVPNFENGVANGYKLFQIVPNSIYDKLGLQNGDVITGLNGQPINDPGKAFEMLSDLKTSNHLELQVKKDGKVLNNVYDIR